MHADRNTMRTGAIDPMSVAAAIEATTRSRPRLLVYGSPAFVPAGCTTATSMPALGFPGVRGGLHWCVRVNAPCVELRGRGRSASVMLRVPVTLALAGARLAHDAVNDRWIVAAASAAAGEVPIVSSAHLEVIVTGRAKRTKSDGRPARVSIAADTIALPAVAPAGLGTVLDCAAQMIVEALLAEVRLSLPRARRCRAARPHLAYARPRRRRADQPNGRTPISGPCSRKAKSAHAATPTTTAMPSRLAGPTGYCAPVARSRRRAAM
jgi:hypothetical protein